MRLLFPVLLTMFVGTFVPIVTADSNVSAEFVETTIDLESKKVEVSDDAYRASALLIFGASAKGVETLSERGEFVRQEGSQLVLRVPKQDAQAIDAFRSRGKFFVSLEKKRADKK